MLLAPSFYYHSGCGCGEHQHQRISAALEKFGPVPSHRTGAQYKRQWICRTVGREFQDCYNGRLLPITLLQPPSPYPTLSCDSNPLTRLSWLQDTQAELPTKIVITRNYAQNCLPPPNKTRLLCRSPSKGVKVSVLARASGLRSPQPPVFRSRCPSSRLDGATSVWTRRNE